MIARPVSADPDLIKMLKLRRKFNETLEDLLKKENNMYIITLSSVVENSYFTENGQLTKAGRLQFWAEVNHQVRLLEENPEDFLASKKTSKQFIEASSSTNNHHKSFHNGKSQCSYYGDDRYHWSAKQRKPSKSPSKKRKLPTPPPRFNNKKLY